jgi:uncharacterized RDD family membrane protein YckC
MHESSPDGAGPPPAAPADVPPFKVAFLATWPRVYAFVLISQALIALGLWLLSEAAS